MFDTIGIRFLNSLPDSFLNIWGGHKRYIDTFENQFFFENTTINAVYHKHGFHNQTPMLNLYTSLPKLVHKCNHTMIRADELSCAINKLNNFLASIPEFSNLGAAERARLSRVDACHNYHVGGDLNNYLHVAKGVDVSRRKKIIYPSGVHHTSIKKTITAYNKYAQCKHREAKGVFRLESSVRDVKEIEKLTKHSFPTLLNLNEKLAKTMMYSALHDLGLDTCIAYNLPELERKIVSAFGNKAFSRNLIHYVHDKNKLEPDNLRELYSRATKNTYEKKLRSVGIISTFIEEGEMLCPLVID